MLKDIDPLELNVNKPPLVPETGEPTLPPLTALIDRTSPVSISLSAPLPLSSNTLALYVLSSSIVPTSSWAMGRSFTPLIVKATVTFWLPP